jgi:hypothetical protein
MTFHKALMTVINTTTVANRTIFTSFDILLAVSVVSSKVLIMQDRQFAEAYTPEHAQRQAIIAQFQVTVRNKFAGRDLISKSISRRFGTWSEIPAVINTIRYVTADDIVVYTARSNPRS